MWGYELDQDGYVIGYHYWANDNPPQDGRVWLRDSPPERIADDCGQPLYRIEKDRLKRVAQKVDKELLTQERKEELKEEVIDTLLLKMIEKNISAKQLIELLGL